MDERRNAHRWDLLLFLPVHDASNGEFVGYIADITEQGFLVFSAEHIELGREYAMEVQQFPLPSKNTPSSSIAHPA